MKKSFLVVLLAGLLSIPSAVSGRGQLVRIDPRGLELGKRQEIHPHGRRCKPVRIALGHQGHQRGVGRAERSLQV